MLGEHPPEQGDASDKYFLAGVEVGPFYQVVGHRIGGGMGNWPNGFGDGRVKFTHGPNRVRGNLAAIQGRGKDKRPNDSLFVLIIPVVRAEPAANVCASVDAIVKRTSEKPGACRSVRAKVAKIKDDLDTGVNDRPHMGS